MKLQRLLCLLLFLKIVSTQRKCEDLTIAVCRQLPLKYNRTFVPNFDKQRTQKEAEQSIQQIITSMNTLCSRDFLYLVCAYYAPICTPYGSMIPPCRSLCKRVKRDCAWQLRQKRKNNAASGSGARRPLFSCKQFPTGKNQVCFGRHKSGGKAFLRR